MSFLYILLKEHPAFFLFLSIAIGCYLGKIKIGSFIIGNVIGVLLASIIIGQLGVQIDPVMKHFMFALYVYAVGYSCGPQFFKSLDKYVIKDFLLVLFLFLVSFGLVVLCIKLFELNAGASLGIAAGSLTQSTILGSAAEALNMLGVPSEQAGKLQADLADTFATTYVFGTFCIIIFISYVLEIIFKRKIYNDAQDYELQQKISNSSKLIHEESLLNRQAYISLVFRADFNFEQSAKSLEHSLKHMITIQKIKRAGVLLEIDDDLRIQKNDEVLIFGRPDIVVRCKEIIGKNSSRPTGDMKKDLVKHKVVLAKKEFAFLTLQDIYDYRSAGEFKSLCLLNAKRNGKNISLSHLQTKLMLGDVFEVYGDEFEINKLANRFGYVILEQTKTDFIFLGFGLAIGMLINTIEIKVMSHEFVLGSGGALFSGLFFGWLNNKRNNISIIPSDTVFFLQDFGLLGFIALIGLSIGKDFFVLLNQSGWSLVFMGVFLPLLTLFTTALFAWFCLGYRNIALLAGALAGAIGSSATLSLILEKSKNITPIVPFVVTFALGRMILPLLVPLILIVVK